MFATSLPVKSQQKPKTTYGRAARKGAKFKMRATGYAEYIGRVGALAVALGIGAALLNNAGVALGDDGEGSPGRNDTSGSGTGEPSKSEPDATDSTLGDKSDESPSPSPSVSDGAQSPGIDDEDDDDELAPIDPDAESSVSVEEIDEGGEGADVPDVTTDSLDDVAPELPVGDVEEPTAPETEPTNPVVAAPDAPEADTPAADEPRDGSSVHLGLVTAIDDSEDEADTVTSIGAESELDTALAEQASLDPDSNPAPLVPSTDADPLLSSAPPETAPSTGPDVAQIPQSTTSEGGALILNLLGGLNPFQPEDSPVGSPFGLALLAAGSRPRQVDDRAVDGQQLAATQSSSAAPDVFGTQTGSNPTGVVISADGTRIYVANTGSNTVSVIDNDTTSGDYKQVIKTISVGSAPSAMALNSDGSRLYVANSGSVTVSVIGIDTATDTYERIDANPSIFSKDIAVGWAPSALALSPDGTRLYVANRLTSTVSVVSIDTATDTYQRIDANPSIFSRDIAVGWSPTALALTADGTRLYVANSASNTVSAINIDTASNTYQRIDANPSIFSRDIAVGLAPSALALNPDGTRLYVANSGSNTVSLIDVTDDGFETVDTDPTASGTQSLFVGSTPTSVVVSADGSKVYVALSSDMVAVIDAATNVVSLAAVDAQPETGSHALALGPDGGVFLTDRADGTVRHLGQFDGTVTIGRSTLALASGTGYTVEATWYFPNSDEPPAGLIYLQHGGSRQDIHVAALAQQLAERTNSIVVTPTISSNGWDRFYMQNEITEQAVAGLFQGDRVALTASAAAAAGHSVDLPQQFVFAGHSLGGSLVSAAAGHLAKADKTADLKAVILFDRNGDDFNATASLNNLTGTHAVPVRLISSPPCACNTWGIGTMLSLSTQPENFMAIVLNGGTHLDAEGASTDLLGLAGCWQATPPPSNVMAVQTLAVDWITDAFTGSQTGVYDPVGSIVSLDGGRTAEVFVARGVNQPSLAV